MNRTTIPIRTCSVALKVILKCIVVFALSRIRVVFISLFFFIISLWNIYLLPYACDSFSSIHMRFERIAKLLWFLPIIDDCPDYLTHFRIIWPFGSINPLKQNQHLILQKRHGWRIERKRKGEATLVVSNSNWNIHLRLMLQTIRSFAINSCHSQWGLGCCMACCCRAPHGSFDSLSSMLTNTMSTSSLSTLPLFTRNAANAFWLVIIFTR